MSLFSDSTWNYINLRIDLVHPENEARRLKEWNDAYPPIINEKFMIHQYKTKEVSKILA